MTEERITETRTPTGEATHTHTTVITDEKPSGGAGKWLFLVVLIVAAVAALFVFAQMGDAEAAKDTAIADAAGEVGEAADQIGQAAGQAGDAAEEAAGSVQN